MKLENLFMNAAEAAVWNMYYHANPHPVVGKLCRLEHLVSFVGLIISNGSRNGVNKRCMEMEELSIFTVNKHAW